jgi:hypothetical protein
VPGPTGHDDLDTLAPKEWDDFISHASEDKDAFVRPLAQLLERLGVHVWYDEFSLDVGDSLSRSIDYGLSRSRYGVVVISPAFIQKPWPEYELRGLTAREIGADKVVLPIWHCVTRDDVLAFSPPLADKYALNTRGLTLSAIALRLLAVIRPDLRDALHAVAAFERLRRETQSEQVPLSTIQPGPIRHETLSRPLLIRIKEIHRVFSEVLDVSLEETINNFRRDLQPASEVALWEAMASAYRDLLAAKERTLPEREALFSAILAMSSGMPPERILEASPHLTPDLAVEAAGRSPTQLLKSQRPTPE